MSSELLEDLESLVRAMLDEEEFSDFEIIRHEANLFELTHEQSSTILVAGPPVWRENEALKDRLAGRQYAPLLVLVGQDVDFDSFPKGDGDLGRTFGSQNVLCIGLPVHRQRLHINLRGLARLAAAENEASQDHFWVQRYKYELDELIDIARAISLERNIDKLLDLILTKARYITAADAGSVYVMEPAEELEDGTRKPESLRFKVTQNESVQIDFREFTMPISNKSIVGNAVLRKESINIPDLYQLQPDNEWGVKHNRTFDEKMGYESHSMLTVPMLNQREEVIGVIQLINKKSNPKERLKKGESFDKDVVPFDERSETMAMALASQAGISLENALLYDEVQRLFEGFVKAAVVAIESRDPSTSGHSQRVSDLTVGLATAVDAVGSGPFKEITFSSDQVKELEYASLLHDFGKVGVREQVLVKAKKLYEPQRELVLQRFDFVRQRKQAEIFEKKLSIMKEGNSAEKQVQLLAELDEELAAYLTEIDGIEEFLLKVNEPTVLDSSGFERLDDIAKLSYVNWKGAEQPFITADEVIALKIPRGSLTQDERLQIESHVTHTYQFLRAIPWTRVLRDVPKIAWMHHEKLNGKGYPRGIDAPQIPIQTRMMTISDIFDALTARDRPYKRAVPYEKALKILGWEVDEGKLDNELFQVFIEAEIFRKVL